jgi:hypothetical protein
MGRGGAGARGCEGEDSRRSACFLGHSHSRDGMGQVGRDGGGGGGVSSRRLAAAGDGVTRSV